MEHKITIKIFSNTYRNIWDDFLDVALNGHFIFKRDFMEYHKDRFQDHSLIFLKGENVVAILPGNIDDNVYWSHQGLSFGGFVYKKFIRHFEVEEVFISFLEYITKSSFRSFQCKQIPSIYFSSFAQPDSFIFQEYGLQCVRKDLSTIMTLKDYPKGRKTRLINKAIREGITVVEPYDFTETWKLLLYRLEEKYHVKPVHSLAEITLLHQCFPKNISCKVAKNIKGDTIGAVVLFLQYPVVHLQYTATSEEGRRGGGLDLIIHQVIEEYKSKFTWLSFGVSTESQGKIVNHSLLRYKESWGGMPLTHDFYELQLPLFE